MRANLTPLIPSPKCRGDGSLACNLEVWSETGIGSDIGCGRHDLKVVRYIACAIGAISLEGSEDPSLRCFSPLHYGEGQGGEVKIIGD